MRGLLKSVSTILVAFACAILVNLGYTRDCINNPIAAVALLAVGYMLIILAEEI